MQLAWGRVVVRWQGAYGGLESVPERWSGVLEGMSSWRSGCDQCDTPLEGAVFSGPVF